METGGPLKAAGPDPARALALADFAGLDWSRPWYAPYAGLGRPAADRAAAGAPVHEALSACGPAPVRFVPQEALPPGTAYEAHIAAHGECPTRQNLHDFFNGLAWLRFPACKRQLNRLQATEIGRDGVRPVRGPVRDAVTLLDENGAFLDAPAPLWDALLARDWRRAFVDLRPAWAQARLVVFGHALLEKLHRPRKDMTAHVWRFPVPLAGLPAADAAIAGQLDARTLAAKPFTPLPVMGIPGWCAENENFSFYDDSFVFRPARP